MAQAQLTANEISKEFAIPIEEYEEEDTELETITEDFTLKKSCEWGEFTSLSKPI